MPFLYTSSTVNKPIYSSYTLHDTLILTTELGKTLVYSIFIPLYLLSFRQLTVQLASTTIHRKDVHRFLTD